jgi:hypothetical protein
MYSAKINFKDVLMPGNYNVNLGLSHLISGNAIDWVEGVCAFRVNKETAHSNTEYPWTTIHGYFKPNVSWTIEQQNGN